MKPAAPDDADNFVPPRQIELYHGEADCRWVPLGLRSFLVWDSDYEHYPNPEQLDALEDILERRGDQAEIESLIVEAPLLLGGARPYIASGGRYAKNLALYKDRLRAQLAIGELTTFGLDWCLVQLGSLKDRPLVNRDVCAELEALLQNVNHQRNYLEENLTFAREDIGLHRIRPDCRALIVIGRAEDADDAFEELRHSEGFPKRITILTYDELYENASSVALTIEQERGRVALQRVSRTQKFWRSPRSQRPVLSVKGQHARRPGPSVADRAQVEELRRLIRDDSFEIPLSKFLLRNPEMLPIGWPMPSGSYIDFWTETVIATRRTDFLVAYSLKHKWAGFVPDWTLHWLLIELKRPSKTPWTNGKPSRDLSCALRQVHSLRRILRAYPDYASNDKAHYGLGLTEIDPTLSATILIGTRRHVSEEFNLFRRQQLLEQHITIRTWDGVLEDATESIRIAHERHQ